MPKTFNSVSLILPWPIPKYRVWKSADVSVCVCVCVCVCVLFWDFIVACFAKQNFLN